MRCPTYNLGNSRINHAHHRDLRHVACAVYVRMARYYDTHRKTGIVASLFGEETAMPYTMFASAVFFAPERHEDCEYRLDPIHIYRCQNGFGNACASTAADKRAASSAR